MVKKIFAIGLLLVVLVAGCSDDDAAAASISGSWLGNLYYPNWPGSPNTLTCAARMLYLADNSLQGFADIGGNDRVIIRGTLSNAAANLLAYDSETTNNFALLAGTRSGKVISGTFTSFGAWAAGGNGTFSLTNIEGVR